MATNQRDVSVGISAQTSGLGSGLNQAVSQLNAAISQMNTSMQSLTSSSQQMQQSVASSLRSMQSQMQAMATAHTASSAQISAGLNQIATNTARPAQAAPRVASAWAQSMQSISNSTSQAINTVSGFSTQVTARMVGAVSTIGLAIVGLRESYKAVAEYEDLESRVQALTGNAANTVKVMTMLRQVSRDLPATFTDIGDAYALLSGQGYKVNEEFLRNVVALNTTSSQTMQHTIQMVGDFMQKDSKRMKQYGIDVKYAGDQATVSYRGMTETIKLTTENVQKLVGTMANVKGGGMDSLKEKMDDTKTAMNRLQEDWQALLVELSKDENGKVGGAIKSALENVNDVVNWLKENVIDFKIVWEQVWQAGTVVFKAFATGVSTMVMVPYAGIKFLLDAAFQYIAAFGAAINNLLSNISNVGSRFFSAISSGNISQAFSGLKGDLTSSLVAPFEGATRNVKSMYQSMWTSMKVDAVQATESVLGTMESSNKKIAALQKRKQDMANQKKVDTSEAIPTVVDPTTLQSKPKGGKGGRTASTMAAELSLIKAQMEAELGILRAQNKLEEQLVEDKYANFMISYEKFARDKEAMQIAEIQREIELRKMAVDEISSKVASGQEKDKIKAATEIVKLNGQIREDEIKILQIKQKTTAEIQKQQREMEKLMINLRAEFADLTGSFDPSAKIADMRKGLEETLKKMRAEGNTEGASLIEKMMDVKEAKLRIDFIDREMSVFTTKRETEMLKIDGLVSQGKLTFTDAEALKKKALDETNQEMLRFIDLQIEQARLAGDPAVIANLEKRKVEIQNQVGQMDKLTMSVKQSIENNLGTALSDMMNGTKSVSEAFKDMFNNILKEFNNMIAQQLAKDLMGQLMPQSGGGAGGGIGSLIGSLFGGGGGAAAGGGGSGSMISSLMSMAGSFFGGFRENGGSVSAGQAYIVGEKRPEVFVPNQSGTIIPQVGGGGSTNVFHISTPDANSFRRSEAQISNQYANAMNRSLRRNS